jgi:uncharacterized protein (TIGR02646 family)
MRRINRGPAPPQLSELHESVSEWGEIPPDTKMAIRSSLWTSQAHLCAYCEGALHAVDGPWHIEHFRRKNKNHFPELTFVWANLFASCDGVSSGNPRHCGHYKDKAHGDAYAPDDLIKPDEDDPAEYLFFGRLGTVDARNGIDARRKTKASETIRVFGLNDGALRHKRRRVLERYLATPDFIEELVTWSVTERRSYLEDELHTSPHSAVIRDFFSH